MDNVTAHGPSVFEPEAIAHTRCWRRLPARRATGRGVAITCRVPSPHCPAVHRTACLLLCFCADVTVSAAGAPTPFEPVKPPEWVYDVTRMVFCTPGEIPDAVGAGAQVVQTNIC